MVTREQHGACLAAGIAILVAGSAEAGRINHAGRILGDVPAVTNAILFNTSEADAVIAALQIMPTDNPWNEDISNRPLITNSAAMISQIYSDLSASRKNLRVFHEMNFVLVPDSQALVPVSFVDYPGESDPSPYPIPSNLPVEGWPLAPAGLSLHDWQIDINSDGGDRHSITVRPGNGDFWETWQTLLVDTAWQASNGAKFNFNTNGLRPDGWTSADAAGLPMFPALIRYDECERGEIEHALRVVFPRTRRAYIYPATHYASTNVTGHLPAMGQRFRLKASYAIPSGWTSQEKAVCRALKKYGGLVADNGGFFSVSAVPDDRFPSGCFDNLQTYLSITNFEVVLTTGATEGPRSPGKPVSEAGPDVVVDVHATNNLQGSVVTTGGAVTVQWTLYLGPAPATFADSALTNSPVSFSIPGTYILMLRASDGIHAPAYDTVSFTVHSTLKLGMAISGDNLSMTWTGAAPPFVLQTVTDLTSTVWSNVQSNSNTSAVLPLAGDTRFYRVTGR